MQKEYYLFLDETKPNAHGNYFALGGYAIQKEEYENVLKPQLGKNQIRFNAQPRITTAFI